MDTLWLLLGLRPIVRTDDDFATNIKHLTAQLLEQKCADKCLILVAKCRKLFF